VDASIDPFFYKELKLGAGVAAWGVLRVALEVWISRGERAGRERAVPWAAIWDQTGRRRLRAVRL
jgi:hypothetical protein